MLIQTSRLRIGGVAPEEAQMLSDYHRRNADHLAPWAPTRPDGYHSVEAWFDRATDQAAAAKAGTSFHYALRAEADGAILGLCNFTNVVRGAFQACHLGYSLDGDQEGQGLMYEALSALIPRIFADHGLHRIMANYRPDNTRSARLLNRLGFEKEGYARDYLKIAGQWRDHILTSRINDVGDERAQVVSDLERR
ncbi:GNAT family N-acetyltransferase [Gymnodinialimonas sp. 2305UL16-5]|uniref:GNAT family N-acetyltransferase n=1 Tax=Gymnodinialimonas mytili TaxID=3126503 RepID=UPI0030A685DE